MASAPSGSSSGRFQSAQQEKEYKEAKLQAEKELQIAQKKLAAAKRAEAEKVKEAEAKQKAAEKAAAAEAKAAALAKRAADLERDTATVKGLVDGGAVGAKLAAAAKELEPRAMAFALAFYGANGADLAWLKPDRCGAALRAVAPEGDVAAQVDLLFATQQHFHGLDFPKDDAGKALVQQAFKTLFLTEVVDIDAFEAWRDDESEERDAIPGKIKTLTQTTDFFSYLDTVDDDDDEDEDEDED